MTKATEAVQEAEFTEVVEAQETQAPEVRCEITVGINEEGGIYFNIGGTDQSLILVEGLLKYAERHIDTIWQGRLTPAE